MQIPELITKIKESKKYKHLSDEVINQKILEYSKKNPNYAAYPEKIILKDIKTILHKVHGSFQIGSNKKKQKYLEELKTDPNNLDTMDDILKTNASTNERLKSYAQLYEEIFKITGEPRSILDLGCGLNPVSFGYMNLEKVNYYAYDINEEDSKFLNEFFEIEKIKGRSQTLDLSNIENVKKLENADICFMFKLLDVLEKKGHIYSEELIKVLITKCPFLVVSFPTRTVGGRMMNFPHRGWIERMLERIGLKFEKIEFSNELFYIIGK